MKKYVFLSIFYFLIVLPQQLLAQDKKPKVALVLSGGGAKGIAHIPLLQTLDSLGIVPDLIIGTSMGSIVGGLYSMGYSGNAISEITKSVDWGLLFGNHLSLEDVGVEEKSEFNRYLMTVDMIKGKPKLKAALLSDQNLREFLSLYASPVFNVTDFDSLSIPFRAITTDIVNGKEVVLGNGSLMLAMRASMSIPGIFKPIPYKNTLLVDGGILNNFPTDVAKEMGADIIIGSDVGGGMATIDKLDNISTLLFQASMLASNLKNPANRELCDILIDHTEFLTYGTSDFVKSKEIYEEGKLASHKNLDAIVELSNVLKGYEQKNKILPQAKNEFTFDTIEYSNISPENLDLVKARMNIQENKEYSLEELLKGLNRAMGTQLFSQINYSTIIEEGKLGFIFDGEEHSPHQLKGSIHYDTYRSVGLVLNYTGRNILGEASRILISLDIAEHPKARIQYQKIFSKEKIWWWRSEAFGEQLRENVFINGQAAESIKYHYYQFDNQFNANISSLKSYIGLGLDYNHTQLKPTVDPEIDNNLLSLKYYQFNNLSIYTHYLYNTLDNVFFATTGNYIKVKVDRSLFNDVELEYEDETIPNVNSATNGFTKFNLSLEKRIPIQKRISGIIGLNTSFIFEDNLANNQVSINDYGYAINYFLGGNLINPRKDNYVLPGLHESELNVSQFMKLNLGAQVGVINHVYLTPHFDLATVGFSDFNSYIKDAFSPEGSWNDKDATSTLITAGTTISYNSILGPVHLDASWVNEINQIRLFFSVGLELNSSN